MLSQKPPHSANLTTTDAGDGGGETRATGTPAPHTRDEDCAGHLDEHGTCAVCGVWHQEDPCPDCGGRGFHRDSCGWSDVVG